MPNVQVKLTEFSELIDSYTADFVGREWLVKQVNTLLADPTCRFVILTGSAGVGKSAFMAHLAVTHPQWPRYFIRRDSHELLRPSDGKTFFLTIGGQLATLQPGLFKPEKLEIIVRQRIGDVETNGEAIGVRIEELKASPFYSVSILAEQDIRRVAGTATGVEIGHLVTEPRLLSLQDLQCLGLLDPAWLLYQTDPKARIVVLVDALDELRFSPAQEDILAALSQLPVGLTNPEEPKIASPGQKLPELPPNLRFVITSRREQFLDRLLGRSDVRELRLNVLADDNRKDLHTYAEANLSVMKLEPALSQENETTDGFIRDLLDKAAGNFLYLRSVLSAIREALADPEKGERLHGLLRVEELPDDLDTLYDYFLNSIVDWVKKSGFGESAWRKYLRPLLGVLAVAKRPLSKVQLMAFTALDAEDLGDLLRELRQFVEPIDRTEELSEVVESVSGQETWRIYHTSFAEYLLDAEKNLDYRIDGSKWHKRIADHYWNMYYMDWSKSDLYGLKHLPIHLKEAAQIERLSELLLDFQWLAGKLQATDVTALLEDYTLVDEAELKLVEEALRLSMRVLGQDRQQLPSQLIGRLVSFEVRKVRIRGLLQQIKEWKGSVWLRPLTSSLPSPGGALVCTLAGHTRLVNTVVVTADEQYAISASDDQTLKVWDLQRGQEIRTLIGHKAEVNDAVLTADGRYVLSASRDGTVKVWDWWQAKEVSTLRGHSDNINRVVMTPDGRYAISASDDQTLKVWDWQQGKEERTLSGHWHAVTAVAVIYHGQNAISVGGDGTLRVWDLISGEEVGMILAHSQPIVALVMTRDERYAITVSLDGKIKVWDLQNGNQVHTLEGHRRWITSVVVTPDGHFAISASRDETLKVWDLQGGQEIGTLRGHVAEVNDVVLTSDGRYVLSASRDRTVKVWDWRQAKEVSSLRGHSEQVKKVVLTRKEHYAISASGDNTLKVWDWRQPNEVDAQDSHRTTVTALLMLDDHHVLSASADNTLKVWNWQDGKLLRTLEGHALPVMTVVLTFDGHHVISASADNTLKVWDWQEGKEERTLEGGWARFDVQPLDEGHIGVVRDVVLTRDGRYAISASDDDTLKVWDWQEGQVVRTLVGHSEVVAAVTVTPDGQYAISASVDGTLKVWDWQLGKLIHTLSGHSNVVAKVALTPDGRYAISASVDGTLKVWDWQVGKEMHSLTGHSGAVNNLALTSDGGFVVSTSEDTTLKVWDWQAGKEVRTLRGHSGNINGVVLTPDGRHAISASDDQTLKVWDWQNGVLITNFIGEAKMRASPVASSIASIITGDISGRMYFLKLEGFDADYLI